VTILAGTLQNKKMKAIEIKGLRKVYADGVEAVKGIDLEVKKGDFFGLLGPNGAGKTTTIGIITDLVTKTEGEIKVFGKNIEDHHEEAKKLMGVVQQEINLAHYDSVMEVVLAQAGYYGITRKKARPKAEQLLKQFGLWEKRGALTRVLSGGMKRRLMIAKALVHDPKLLILDEPTAGVDAELRNEMYVFLKDLNKKGMTIILTTHYLEEAEELCKHIAIIHKGEILAHAPTKTLIKMVDQETFVLDLEKPIKNLTSKDFPITLIDDHTIEVTICKEHNLNKLFEFLDKKKIKVSSMKNKQNRLEQFFLEVVRGKE